jgi:phosphate transport system permease protein
MHAPANLFQTTRSSARVAESTFFTVFRIFTYIIVAVTGFVFADIIWKGGQVVFRSTPPFVNIEFLTQKPETLHVFKFEGKQMELPDTKFRQFEAQHQGQAIEESETYAHSGGGIFPALVGTVILVIGSMTIALFLGICSAIYLSEYAKDGTFIRTIRLAILNLSGVPSIVFGLFGYALFVLFAPIITATPNPAVLHFPILPGQYLSFQGWGVSVLAGWFTLAFMVLPIVITASEESLRAVPKGFREGSLALGATKWTAIATNVIPYALPGMLTSSILGIARVAGETAPIMFTAAYVIRDQLPWEVQNFTDFFFQGVMALPYHIYVVSAKIPQNEYTARMQYGTAFVFLFIVMAIAAASIILRARVRAKYKW